MESQTSMSIPGKETERKVIMDSEVIIVAVDASKEITDYALEWAFRNVTKAMDSLTILALLPCPRPPSSANHLLSCLLRKWGFGDSYKVKNASDYNGFNKTVQQDSFRRINNVCMQMMQQLCLSHDKQVHTQVKIVADAQLGAVATEARELEANWVILDRCLKKEGDFCLKQLTCNIVIIDHAIPKLLSAVNPLAGKRLSVSAMTRSSLGIESTVFNSESLSSKGKEQFYKAGSPSTIKSRSHAPILHLNSDYFHQEVEVQTTFSPSTSYAQSDLIHNESAFKIGDPLDGKIKRSSGLLKTKFDMETPNVIKATQTVSVPTRRSIDSPRLLRKPESPNQLNNRNYCMIIPGEEKPAFPSSPTFQRISSIRKAMPLSIKHPPTSPPLCSICKHKAPIFGKATRKFSYREIESATDGFSRDNLLADGGSGSVYKGILSDGQVVAVKQYKAFSAQGASEFCSEVEILSCAQHRNLVMLVGYCIEREWLLIYEFACNGSLDKHLYGTETNEVMAWHNRMKVAIGAARGLRYLHEDCRVGCIVHRDFRPNNILLTHDFEPMVGDFGLARWQADGQSAVETRVIGSFGYLAPEYTQTGLITEKTDVYAFGVVLLELISGFKATEFSRITGQPFVQEWGCLLLERKMIDAIIDPQLKQNYEEKEVERMMYAASLCISPKPEKRSRMSKVLKILEGDISTDLACNYGQHSTSYLKQYAHNLCVTESPVIPSLDHSPSSSILMQTMHYMNLSPSRKCTDRNNGTFKTLVPFKEEETVRGVQELKQPESNISGEYRAYLQGSLAKFIQNLNGH